VTSSLDRVGSPEDILRRTDAVPSYTRFPALDELLAAFAAVEGERPDLIASELIGSSRQGESIPAYTIGDGALHHLIVGGVHPNEPIGSWTALHLLGQLVADTDLRLRLNATWHIVPCADPDGYRLNEGWLDAPERRDHYARHFYRPAPDEQVEWTFPFSYKKAHFDRMLPETKALARIIDQVRPDLYVPLHNSELGGVYYYLSRPVPPLHDLLHAIPRSLGLPLDLGEPESGHLQAYAPAIFASGTLEEAYDWAEALGLDPYPPGSGGDSSSAYAARHGALSLIAELPYWRHPEANDTGLSDEPYADLLRRAGRDIADLGDILATTLAKAGPYLTRDTAMLRGARAFALLMVGAGTEFQVRSHLPEAQRRATRAERFGCLDVVRMFRLRYGSMARQALEAELAGAPPSSPALAELGRITLDFAARYALWESEAIADDEAAVIPIGRLVAVQYGAILAAAAHLAGLL
jgi:hypothetical protein